ncbi:mechanosensitive ion channel family protein [Kushneria phyllosphaerae]|uniref:Low conductance mechanosensitive channel YnaI n=1 Tax=Kushneria phyllosphaerae TaxID=2100822 RepID=A0A2R8CKC2_9GAMM|nr:mechanosensitive ion channel family protein [Kushneria phyllosphaerae]SPJ33224.1 Low conductance mechanosensitive channel YnaI [Kushneria phyllosphaerae]
MEATALWQDLLTDMRDRMDQLFGLPGWAAMLIGLAFLTVVVDIVSAILLRRLERRLRDSPRRWDDALVHGFRMPFRVWLWSGALCMILTLVAREIEFEGVSRYMALAFGMITLVLVFWGETRLMQRLEQRLVFPPGSSKSTPVDQTTASAVTKIVGAVTLIVVLLLAMQLLGVNMSSILAVGGAGGLLVGFAARDVMANFFGGMVIHLDKPFQVGHWIRSPDREIEGVVEDIGWRLTRIRTFAGPPIYVPNAAFSRITIETPSRMQARLLWENVGIRYQDAGAIEAITSDIREMLDQDDEINSDELITVTFNQYGDYSLNLMIYALSSVTDWQRYNETRQRILLAVRDIIYRHGTELALPASRIYVPDEVRLGQRAQQEDLESEGDSRQDSAPQNSRSTSRSRSGKQNKGQPAPFDTEHNSESDGDA